MPGQKFQFAGRDTDSSDLLVRPDSARYFLNCHVGNGEGANRGAVSTVKGNVQVAFTLPDGENTCIGSLEDTQNDTIIFFIHNSEENHSIFRYYPQTNTVLLVIEWTGLNFSLDHIIRGGGVVDSLLYWTDKFNEPRKINLQRAINTANDLDGDKYPQPYVQDYIARVKRPPNFSPFVSGYVQQESAGSVPYKTGVQFATRYIYEDNEISAISPWSKILFLEIEGDEIADVILLSDITFAQCQTRLIKTVQFIFREGNNGIANVFREIKVGENDTFTTVSTTFTKHESGNPLTRSESVKDFDSSALVSGGLEIARNRLFESDITIGYDSADTTLTVESVLVNTAANASPTMKCFKSRGKYKFAVEYFDKANRKAYANSAVELIFPESFTVEATNPAYNVDDKIFSQTEDGADRRKRHRATWEISGTPPEWAYGYRILQTRCLNIPYFFQTNAKFVYWYNKGTTSDDPENVYYSNTSGSKMKGVALFLNSGEGYTFQSGDRVRILGLYPFGKVVFNFDPTLFRYEYDPLTYTINSGYKKDFEVVEQRGNILLIKTDDQNDWFMSRDEVGEDIIYTNVKIEVYRNAAEIEQEEFFQIGESFAISNPGTAERAHAITSGQLNGDVFFFFSSTSFAEIKSFNMDSDPGDSGFASYAAQIPQTKSESYYEKSNPAKGFDTRWNTDAGHVNIVSLEKGQLSDPNAIRFSNKYLSGSKINGLSSFEALNETVLSIESGPIQVIKIADNAQSEGSVLLAIHQNEIESIYLGETQLRDAGGQSLQAVSDQVIGSANILKGGFGTINPESVVYTNGRVYGWDATKGEVWRYSNDGVTGLSSAYGMKTYFTDLARAQLLYRNQVQVRGGYDYFREEYILTFSEVKDEDDNVLFPALTTAFCETSNRFTSDYSFTPECYGKSNTTLFSFKNGQLWKHNANTLPNHFYGVQYTSRVYYTANGETKEVKVWDGKAIEGNALWVATKITNKEGMESKMLPAWYEKRESDYYGAFRRDKNTPGYTSATLALNEGRPMRSKSLTIEMEYNGLTPARLDFVNVFYTPSSGGKI